MNEMKTYGNLTSIKDTVFVLELANQNDTHTAGDEKRCSLGLYAFIRSEPHLQLCFRTSTLRLWNSGPNWDQK